MQILTKPLNKNYSDQLRSFGDTLIIGAGPTAIQVAVNLSNGWCHRLGMASRMSERTSQFKRDLEDHQFIIRSEVQQENHIHLTGEVKLDCFYEGIHTVEDRWDTIIYCTPSDSYLDVTKQLNVKCLHKVKTIILLSPSIGSSLLVRNQLETAKERIEVISLSTYYAATKFKTDKENLTTCLTKAIKKRVYVGSFGGQATALMLIKDFIEGLGIQCTIVQNAMEAETRNITTYVHPPLFMNEFALNELFYGSGPKKYMYKIYPEGPITQHAIRNMVQLWKELSIFSQLFGAKPFNLLKFLNDDNYPVHDITLSREDIETFVDQNSVKQEYLLYIRYTAILIDPFSVPDKDGKYYDFSAVPFKRVFQDQNGKWVIPRVPLEDYQKLKLIHGLASKMGIDLPKTFELITLFEAKVFQFMTEKGKDSSHVSELLGSSQEELDAIYLEMRDQH